MRFILSCLKKFGINLIEKAYEETVRDFENGISIKIKLLILTQKFINWLKRRGARKRKIF